MNYISTRDNSNSFNFKDVFIKGLADDGGLYIPKFIHKYSQKDLNSFGAGEVLKLGELNGPAISSSQIDKFIPWFDLLCGLALLVGFCTPIAAIATAGFLLTVCLTQFPGAVGAQPVYYQSIEMFALLVVAFAGGGKYLSLDSIINHYCKRCCGKTEQSA